MIEDKLIDPYFIRYDGMNHVLMRRTFVQDSDKLKDKSRIGEEIHTPISYHNTPVQALKKLLRESMVGEDVTQTLQTYVDRMEALVERIENLKLT